MANTTPKNNNSTKKVPGSDKDSDTGDANSDWLTRAKDAYAFSTQYVDSYYRDMWDESIRAFNNEHASDSKYETPGYEKRSRLYRPKTRSIIRKYEAAAAAAYFSNSDVVSITADNQTDTKEIAAAEIIKELIQYRLEKSIPWYQVVMGGFQDAMTVGTSVAHVYWQIEHGDDKEDEQEDETDQAPLQNNPGVLTSGQAQPGGPPAPAPGGNPNQDPLQPADPAAGGAPPPVVIPAAPQPKPITVKKANKLKTDKPVIELIPIENIRIDPGANWADPINSSPYVIQLIPMYVGDVKERMKSGEWLDIDEDVIKQAVQNKTDSTQRTRYKGHGNPYGSDGKTISDIEIVWVQRHIHKVEGIDYDFYTLADLELLTDPVPLSETVFHGQRPYVMGRCMIETHKAMPSSFPEISKGLQAEANEVANQRIDNVKFVLNKRFIVARNKQVDLQSLLRNVPGGITLADSVDDVKEMVWPDVTASAYQEQDRINVDLDELLGNFGAGTIQNNKQLAQTASGMAMLNQSANVLVEYTLRTYTETFVEPILQQLALLERHYETDRDLLRLIGQRSSAFKKVEPGIMHGFSQDKAIDKMSEMLDTELEVKVNVGMGATSPEQKINKLIMGISSYANIVKMGVPNLSIEEIGKEIFGALGYADGSRFIKVSENPEIAQMKKQIMMMQKALMDKQAPTQARVEISKQNNLTKMTIAQMKEGNANNRKLVDHYRALTEKGMGAVADSAAIKANAKVELPQQQAPGQPQGQQMPQQPQGTPGSPQPQGGPLPPHK